VELGYTVYACFPANLIAMVCGCKVRLFSPHCSLNMHMQEIFIFDLHRKFLIFEFAAKKRNILSRPGIFDGATPVQLHSGKTCFTAVGILCNPRTSSTLYSVFIRSSSRVIKSSNRDLYRIKNLIRCFLHSLPAKEDLLQEREDEIMRLLYIGTYM
jgi:hypothetical protein